MILEVIWKQSQYIPNRAADFIHCLHILCVCKQTTSVSQAEQSLVLLK